MSGARAVRETTNVFHVCPRNCLKLQHFLGETEQRFALLRWRNLTVLLFRAVSRCFERIGNMSRRVTPDLKFRITRSA
ncbi:MAG TPA: hypothetical protein VGF76_09540 [Polyangiaceae bacterium]|jgi:hypothetical protein